MYHLLLLEKLCGQSWKASISCFVPGILWQPACIILQYPNNSYPETVDRRTSPSSFPFNEIRNLDISFHTCFVSLQVMWCSLHAHIPKCKHISTYWLFLHNIFWVLIQWVVYVLWNLFFSPNAVSHFSLSLFLLILSEPIIRRTSLYLKAQWRNYLFSSH